MNELKLYIKIVKKAKTRDKPNCYCESHHIWPVSIYGENNSIVWLTAKEHYIVHMLLANIAKKRYGQNHWKTRKLVYAWNMMTWDLRGKRHTSASFVRARKAMAQMNEGDNNPAKNNETRKKISIAKTGVERKDMKGKSYFGASEKAIADGIEKMRVKKTGMKIDYPKNRNSSPCSAAKARAISEGRKKTIDKYVEMSYDEFISWMSAFNMYRRDGRPNPNITRAIVARGESIEQYYGMKNEPKTTI